MSFWSAVAIALAGTGAGIINTIVGSGHAHHLPDAALLRRQPARRQRLEQHRPRRRRRHRGLGLPPRARRAGAHPAPSHADVVRRLGRRGRSAARPAAAAFQAIVPVLILIALVLVVAGPRHPGPAHAERRRGADAALARAGHGVGVFVAGVYGGYFGAAQGVLLMGLLSALSLEPSSGSTATRTSSPSSSTSSPRCVFILFARDHIDWLVVVLIGGRCLRRRDHRGAGRSPASRRTCSAHSSSSSASSPSSSSSGALTPSGAGRRRGAQRALT